MDIVDSILFLFRYAPLFALVVMTMMLLYMQVREVRDRSTSHSYRKNLK